MKITRVTGLLVLVIVSLAQTADCLEMRWASGETDLRFVEARHCTLYLCAAGIAERLPQQWRLAYVIEGGDGDSFGLKPDFSETGSVGVCWSSGGGATAAELAAHKQAVQHCSIYSTARARCARYAFDLAGGARATFRVVVVPHSDLPELPSAALEISTTGAQRSHAHQW